MLRRIWWTSTAAYSEFQPFCAAELRNKPSASQYDASSQAVKIKGDVVIGCDTGTLLFYEMNAVQNNVAVVAGVAIGTTKEILREKIKFNSFMRLRSAEPVTHIYELTSGSQAGMLLTAQIDGSIMIVNYASQSIVLQV